MTFEEAWPHLNDGGVYLCEDLEESCRDRHPCSFIEYTKRLIGRLQFAAIKAQARASPEEEVEHTATVSSGREIADIHFYESMAIIEKKTTLHKNTRRADQKSRGAPWQTRLATWRSRLPGWSVN